MAIIQYLQLRAGFVPAKFYCPQAITKGNYRYYLPYKTTNEQK